MAKPIYAGSYPNRGGGRWKRVFIIIMLLQIAVVAIYLITNKDGGGEQDTATPEEAPAPTDLALPSPLPGMSLPVKEDVVSTVESRAALSDAEAALAGGQLMDAKRILDKLVSETPSPEAIRLMGNVNVQLLESPLMMPGKEYYVIQSGDYLYKIAKTFNTTVELIKQMNGLETDNIRAGARLLVFKSNFTIRVSKQHNHLDLVLNGTLFKRYSVGTGEFGKTPAVEFSIVDKIVEPPWTRPADNRQIEYGDPENVLGTRWMALSSEAHPELTGFGIHGTWERDSIGKQSSAGCVRMLNEDVEELFDLVPRKTTVIITD